MTKLHLGCGNIRLDGFVNIDIRHMDATDRVMDISDLAEFGDNSVDMIYASHCLEHFSFRITLDVLYEWNRVLKKGGELILRIPDFDILVNQYLGGVPRPKGLTFSPEDRFRDMLLKTTKYITGSKDGKSLLARIRTVIRLFFNRENRTLTMNLIGDFLGGQNYPEKYEGLDQHKAIFNEKLITELLSEAGFREVERIDFEYFPADDASKHYGTMGFSCLK